MSGDLLALAVTIAEEAGDLLRERFREDVGAVATKSTPTDPVTEADRAAESLIVRRLREARPEDALVGEEGAENEGTTGVRWIVDPLDGTVNFMFGIPQWAVSIAAEDPEGALVGVVHDPCRGETFAARRGDGATLGGHPIRVSERTALPDALVATGFNYDAAVRRGQAELLVEILPQVRDVRRFGAAALDLAWVAAGRYDGFYEWGLGAWDVAAGELLVSEAGGVVERFAPPSGGGIGLVAAAPSVHPALTRLMSITDRS